MAGTFTTTESVHPTTLHKGWVEGGRVEQQIHYYEISYTHTARTTYRLGEFYNLNVTCCYENGRRIYTSQNLT